MTADTERDLNLVLRLVALLVGFALGKMWGC